MLDKLKRTFIFLIIILGISFIVFYITSNIINYMNYKNLQEDVVASVVTEQTNDTSLSIQIEQTEIEKTTETNLETTTTMAETTTKAEELPEHSALLSINHNDLKRKNPDYRCWLDIPDTKISYPVVFNSDIDYYLHKDFETRKYSYAGTLYIDPYENTGLDSQNIVIYGHNMKSGSMFGNLDFFREKDYFDKHPYFDLYLEDGSVRTFLIISVRTGSSDAHAYDFSLNHIDINEYIDYSIKNAIQSRVTELDTQLCTLVCCVNNDSKRLFITGIKIN